MLTGTAGQEWVVEAYGCDAARLADLPLLQQLVHAVVTELSLHPVGAPQWHQFPAPRGAAHGGITGMVLLAESHLTVHTFPEHASACFNLFCCTPRAEWTWEAQLRTRLLAHDVRVRKLERPYAHAPAPALAS